jgi:histidinol dehydrogenase
MRILHAEQPEHWQELLQLVTRNFSADDHIETAAREIIAAVRRSGDEALLAFTRQFDHVDLQAHELRVPTGALQMARQQVSEAFITALACAHQNITSFHQRQLESSWEFEREGVRLGWRVAPLASVGIYVPGGRALYPSSVLMVAIPARLAGVKRIAMVTPPRIGGMDPHLLVAAEQAGVHEIYQIGGAQAIAALAFGTPSIPAVDKIVGPGNSYVTAAKRQVFGVVDVDGIAGPSEIAILADETADAEWVARDLISQLEHDVEAKAVLVTTDANLAQRVAARVKELAPQVARAAIVQESVRRHAAALIVRSMDEGLAVINEIAPEHLEIITAAPRLVAEKTTNAATIFLGPYTPVPMGDYIAGANHTLPTGRSARFSSPLGVTDFCKRMSVVEYSREAFVRESKHVETLAEIEGLPNHAEAAMARKK